ncbi:MAG: ABC transporter permease [Nocardioides sp.]
MSDLETHGSVGAGTVTAEGAPPSAIEGKSPFQLALGRLRRDKLTMIALGFVVTYVLAAIAAPFMVKAGLLDPFTLNQDLIGPDTIPIGAFGGISADHPLGIEPGIGRDALSRIWYGLTFSLGIALTATLISIGLGVFIGIVSGASGGKTDAVLGRFTDLTLAFPQTLMVLALYSLGLSFITTKLQIPDGDLANAIYVTAILGLFGWTGVSRLIRGQVLSIREREFVEAAKMIGASRWRIYFREILPNLWAPILITFTLYMPVFVSAEAALSFLGVGIDPPTPTLGNVLADSLDYAQADFVYFFAPAAMIAIIVVSFNLLGDGLRDALDPKADR